MWSENDVLNAFSDRYAVIVYRQVIQRYATNKADYLTKIGKRGLSSLKMVADEEFQKEPSMTWPNVWDVFLKVRKGELPNPCPPEVGLRMAKLWDAIKVSSAQGGAPVRT